MVAPIYEALVGSYRRQNTVSKLSSMYASFCICKHAPSNRHHMNSFHCPPSSHPYQSNELRGARPLVPTANSCLCSFACSKCSLASDSLVAGQRLLHVVGCTVVTTCRPAAAAAGVPEEGFPFERHRLWSWRD